jgi:hypothetical protein
MKEVETYLQHCNDEHLDSATMRDLKDDALKWQRCSTFNLDVEDLKVEDLEDEELP